MKGKLSDWLPEASPLLLEELAAQPDLCRALEGVLAYSPVYRRWLGTHPDCLEWLCREADPFGPPMGPGRLATRWAAFPRHGGAPFDDLRRFRRMHSVRLALRDWAGADQLDTVLAETSHLADFCIGTVIAHTHAAFIERHGVPWNEEADAPAAYCVFALGKLGGRELNFFSDVDLLFCYDGEGHCRREGRPTALHNRDFFQRMLAESCRAIQRRTPEGLLYHVDLRLRPEGDAGPLAPSLTALIDYYYTRGQTWERLALLKARRIHGSPEIEHEFAEMIHSFRYPRHAPAALPAEIAELRARTEAEVVGADALARDIKNGTGGIREIEFFVQVLQLLHGSRFPFLQTPNTIEALQQLNRYGLVQRNTVHRLLESYRFLRRLENRLQMQEEQPEHCLPQTAEGRAALAAGLGFADWEALHAVLKRHRRLVRANWERLFPGAATDPARTEWLAFFTTGEAAPAVRQSLQEWFGTRAEAGGAILRNVIAGTDRRPITRDQMTLFLRLSRSFPAVFAGLADPLLTLGRVSAFAETYRARHLFLKACEAHPPLLRMLCLLFDRSTFIFQLLIRHPSIMEELAGYTGRRNKDVADHRDAMQHGPKQDFARWLWLYVKAEQVRIASNYLLGLGTLEATEAQLSSLAEAACQAALARADPDGGCCLVALGKFGGAELTLGSDLDLLVLAPQGATTGSLAALGRLLELLGWNHPLGRTFEIDLRLRPHGADGALVVSMDRLRRYHRSQARFWEVQLLTRARPVAGNPGLAQAFAEFRKERLFGGRPVTPAQWQELASARQRMLEEKTDPLEPARTFKSGPGGLVDIEFLTQRWALALGHRYPALRAHSTRALLRALVGEGLIPPHPGRALLRDYNHLRQLEFHLRAETNSNLSRLPDDPALCEKLARWLGDASAADLLARLRSLMRKTSARTALLLPPSS